MYVCVCTCVCIYWIDVQNKTITFQYICISFFSQDEDKCKPGCTGIVFRITAFLVVCPCHIFLRTSFLSSLINVYKESLCTCWVNFHCTIVELWGKCVQVLVCIFVLLPNTAIFILYLHFIKFSYRCEDLKSEFSIPHFIAKGKRLKYKKKKVYDS